MTTSAKRIRLVTDVASSAIGGVASTTTSEPARAKLSSPTRYWVGTVSKAHACRGVEGGFAQLCHGKKGALARMKKGDFLIYYSPKQEMEGKQILQKFTAIGRVKDDKEPYPFEMAPGFVPFRKDVDYFRGVKEVPIRPLVERLSFIKNKQSWGMVFRYGVLEIPVEDFNLIAREMGVGLLPADVDKKE